MINLNLNSKISITNLQEDNKENKKESNTASEKAIEVLFNVPIREKEIKKRKVAKKTSDERILCYWKKLVVTEYNQFPSNCLFQFPNFPTMVAYCKIANSSKRNDLKSLEDIEEAIEKAKIYLLNLKKDLDKLKNLLIKNTGQKFLTDLISDIIKAINLFRSFQETYIKTSLPKYLPWIIPEGRSEEQKVLKYDCLMEKISELRCQFTTNNEKFGIIIEPSFSRLSAYCFFYGSFEDITLSKADFEDEKKIEAYQALLCKHIDKVLKKHEIKNIPDLVLCLIHFEVI